MNVYAIGKRPRKVAVSSSPWISVKQAAEYLGVGPGFVYDALKTKGLRFSRVGHSTLRLKREWIDEWLVAHAEPKR